MKRFQKLIALVLAVITIVSLLSVVRAFAATAQTNVQTAAATGEPEQEGDIDIPLYPQVTLTKLVISKEPNKLTYRQGEALDTAGLKVQAIYSDSSSSQVTNYKVSGFNPNKLGKQTVTVSLEGKTATFTVTVYAVGDVDGDGKITSADATKILQHEAGWGVAINTSAADVDGNGQINRDDATKILQHVAGWDITLG